MESKDMELLHLKQVYDGLVKHQRAVEQGDIPSFEQWSEVTGENREAYWQKVAGPYIHAR